MAVPPPTPAPPASAPTGDSAGAKATIRAAMRRDRDAFVAGHAPVLTPLPPLAALFRRGRVIAGYVAMGSEADPAPLLAAAHRQGCRIVLPHVTRRDEPMRFLAWQPGQALAAGLFGLSQPAAHVEQVSPDVVLTPLVAFDAALNRLGQGAGFYDRAFAELPDALRIGVAWSMQQVERIPTDPWDAPLHAIITEKDWITAQ